MVESQVMKTEVEKQIKNEKGEGSFLRFLAPAAVAVSGATLLGLLSLLWLFPFPIFELIVPLNSVSGNLLLLFLSQMSGAVIFYFGLMRIFKLRNVEHRPLSGNNFRRTLIAIIASYGAYTLSAIILVYMFAAFNWIPQTGYGAIIIKEEQIMDVFTVFLYFVVPTFGAGIYEELVFRRAVIPSLEKKGMSAGAAATTSALLFALWHFPNDLINGNLAGGIIHVWGVFVIAIVLGLIYVITRNVVYSMFMHATFNLISFMGPFMLVQPNPLYLVTWSLFVFMLLIVGIIAAVYLLVQYFRRPNMEWVRIVKEKSPIKIRAGFAGFIIIGMAILTLLVLIEIGVSIMIITGFNYYLALMIITLCYGAVFVAIIWIHSRIKHEHVRKNQEIKK